MSDDQKNIFVAGFKLSRNGTKGTSTAIYYRCNKKSLTNEKCKVAYRYNPSTRELITLHDTDARHAEKDVDAMDDHFLRRFLRDRASERRSDQPSKQFVIDAINQQPCSPESKITLKSKVDDYVAYLNRQPRVEEEEYELMDVVDEPVENGEPVVSTI